MGLIQRLARNQATVNDPQEIYNTRCFLVCFAACGGAFLFGFDMGVIGGVLTMEPFQREYGLFSESEHRIAQLESNIVSVIQAGAFLGAIVAMWLANRIGRRLSLIIASILVFIGVSMQAAASGFVSVLYIGRFIAGVAIGLASTVTPLYLSENAPKGIRGFLTGLYQLTLVSGLLLAFWINYACLLHAEGRTMFLVPLSLQVLPAVILFFGMLFANESPRWLAQHRPHQALSTLAKLRGLPEDNIFVLQEYNDMACQLEEELEARGSASRFSILKEAFAVKSYRRRSILCITLMMWSNLTGTNAMTYYSPSIFASIGFTGAEIGLLSTGIYGVVKVIACAIFIILVSDSLGRRRSLLWSGCVQGLALYYVGFFIRFSPPVEGEPVQAQGYVAIVAIYIFAAVYQFGWGPVVWTYCSEIPPARLRALNMGMATASQWLFNFIVAKCTPLMFATLGANGFGTYFLYGTFCFAMVVYAWLLVPETKGLSLESMDELFAQKNVRRRFEPSLTLFEQRDQEFVGKHLSSVEHVEAVGK